MPQKFTTEEFIRRAHTFRARGRLRPFLEKRERYIPKTYHSIHLKTIAL